MHSKLIRFTYWLHRYIFPVWLIQMHFFMLSGTEQDKLLAYAEEADTRP